MVKIGETHQGLFDLAFLSTIPNFVIMAPKDFKELEEMLEFGINLNKPVAIRYPRGEEGKEKFEKCDDISLGKAEIIKEGNDLTIVAIGKMVEKAIQISKLLKQKNVDSEIINARFLKPVDKDTIIKSIEKTKNVITLEDGTIKGGLGSTIIELISNYNLKNTKIKTFGYNDCFVKHGKVEELEKEYGLDINDIVQSLN